MWSDVSCRQEKRIKRGTNKLKKKSSLWILQKLPWEEYLNIIGISRGRSILAEHLPKQEFQNLCFYIHAVATGEHTPVPSSLSIPPPFVLNTEPKFHQSYQNYKCHSFCPCQGGIISQINSHMCQMVLLDCKWSGVTSSFAITVEYYAAIQIGWDLLTLIWSNCWDTF